MRLQLRLGDDHPIVEAFLRVERSVSRLSTDLHLRYRPVAGAERLSRREFATEAEKVSEAARTFLDAARPRILARVSWRPE